MKEAEGRKDDDARKEDRKEDEGKKVGGKRGRTMKENEEGR